MRNGRKLKRGGDECAGSAVQIACLAIAIILLGWPSAGRAQSVANPPVAAKIKPTSVEAPVKVQTPPKARGQKNATDAKPSQKATEPAEKSKAAPGTANDSSPPTVTEGAQSVSPAETAVASEPPPPPTPEAIFMAAIDELIAPVRDFVLSPEDAQRVKEAIRLNATADHAAARVMRQQIVEPAARKLLEWLTLRGGIGEPQEFVTFLNANPAWPERVLLGRRAEDQIFTAGGSAQKIKAFFRDGEPKTGAGWAALASVYLAEGDEAKARAAAAKVWREYELASSFETGFVERFGKLLTEADHRRRLDRILVDEVRFTAERADRAAIARRIVALLAEPERKKAEARIAIFLRARNAGQLLSAIPPDAEDQPVDWGLAYQKIQHFRRLGQYEEARKLLLAAPTDPEIIISPDDWWVERRAAAYEALREGKAETAFALVRAAGPLSINPLKDQTFLAGWIALRHLAMADEAAKFFAASRKAADGPLSRTRADYWLGRALETLDRKQEARKHYSAAAAEFDTFHGQLSRQKLTAGASVDIRPPLPAAPTAEQAQRFNALDAVRAAVIANKLGLDRNIKAAMFAHLRNHLETEGEMVMLAHLAAALGDTQASLRVGKTGISRGLNLFIYGYPLHAFPTYTPLRDPPEPAMLLGIARQETEFNSTIVSTAGARGLLQVMPITAQHICRDHKIKCDLARLITDNAYNAMIASAYIGDRMAEFRGNYVLTLAGYNAGPGRARQWMREFGDPRDAAIDPIDWIERIPIEETREYVKKVLANVQVYRARLGDASALRLEQDLTRTIGGRRPASKEPERAADPQ